MNSRLNYYILLFTVTFAASVSAENPDSTLNKIRQNKSIIQKASVQFNVDPVVLSAIIFIERTRNYTWEDEAMDDFLAFAGLNSSIGFCQIKLKTAYWIESQLNDSLSMFYPGSPYYGMVSKSKSAGELVEKLNNNELNIMFASAYLRIMISRWKNAGISLDDQPEILGTLYSTGLFYSSGQERKPNPFPQANTFGIDVKSTIPLLSKMFN